MRFTNFYDDDDDADKLLTSNMLCLIIANKALRTRKIYAHAFYFPKT